MDGRRHDRHRLPQRLADRVHGRRSKRLYASVVRYGHVSARRGRLGGARLRRQSARLQQRHGCARTPRRQARFLIDLDRSLPGEVMARAFVAVFALLCGAAVLAPALKAQPDSRSSSIPRLGYADFGWFPASDDFQRPSAGAGPVVSDPAHPYYSNQSGRQPTDRVADLTNPILKPWVIERMRKTNNETLSGKIPYSPRETCHLAGVPAFDVFSRLRPVYFLQTDKQVTIINEGDQQVRRVYLNVAHSKNLKPSWYGESVGHYENGDTLVVDTIGLNDKTF